MENKEFGGDLSYGGKNLTNGQPLSPAESKQNVPIPSGNPDPNDMVYQTLRATLAREPTDQTPAFNDSNGANGFANGFMNALSVFSMLGSALNSNGLSQGKPPSSQLTFREYSKMCLNTGMHGVSSRTLENYRVGTMMASRYIGGFKVSDITLAILQELIRSVSLDYAASTVKSIHRAVGLILREAHARGDIKEDPTVRWRIPKNLLAIEPHKDKVYSDEEVNHILVTSKEYDLELHTMLQLLNSTGMRPGEMLALKWEDFDEDNQSIFINKTVTREFECIETLDKAGKSHGIISSPKSPYSVRQIPLSTAMTNILIEWHKHILADKNKKKVGSPYIFPGNDGEFRSISGINTKLQRFRDRYGISGVTFYKFRHTLCTRLAVAGFPISITQRIMGDNTVDVILKVYTHVDNAAAVTAMRNYLMEQEALADEKTRNERGANSTQKST